MQIRHPDSRISATFSTPRIDPGKVIGNPKSALKNLNGAHFHQEHLISELFDSGVVPQPWNLVMGLGGHLNLAIIFQENDAD